ncbi:MAG: hypothetical protein ACYC5Y_13710 [Symbiobacteriia bacterium]
MNYKPIGFQPVTPWVTTNRPVAQDPLQRPAGIPNQMPAGAPQMPAAAPAPHATPAQAPAAAAPQSAADERSCIGSQDLVFLRSDICGEVEAINQYWSHIQAAKEPRVKALLCEIMNDEKHHYAEITALIRALDPYQNKQFERVEKEGH